MPFAEIRDSMQISPKVRACVQYEAVSMSITQKFIEPSNVESTHNMLYIAYLNMQENMYQDKVLFFTKIKIIGKF